MGEVGTEESKEHGATEGIAAKETVVKHTDRA